MKKCLFFFVAFIGFCCTALADVPHDVLTHASGDWAWFAQVNKSSVNNPVETPSSIEQTDLFVRQKGPGEQWRQMPAMTGRATALASRSSQLAVLMNDGQWLTVWSDGSATGQPLPAGGQIKILSDDGVDLWAIGSVNGGIGAANAAIARDTAATQPQPTTSHVGSQQASNASSIPEAASQVVQPTKLVLFELSNGRWETYCEVDIEPTASTDDLSLAVVGGTGSTSKILTIASRNAAGGIDIRQFTDKHWQMIGTIRLNEKQSISSFRLLSDGFKPMLWTTGGNEAGQLYTDISGKTAPITLQWTGVLQLDGIPSATFAGQYVCVFGLHAGKVLEQRFKKDGTVVESAAELTVQDGNETVVPRWLEVVLLAFAGFSFGSVMFRQWTQGEQAIVVTSPLPAPLVQRFMAGLIDAIPVIAAVAYLLAKDASADQASITPIKVASILGGAILFYLLHTTLVEVFTGRSAGKWACGLKVVDINGSAASQAQLIWRNLLRIVDPLIMIIMSPLRQRAADTVMGTMVIRASESATQESEDAVSENLNDKVDAN